MISSLRLSIHTDGRPEQVADLTRDLATDLSRRPEFDVHEVTRTSAPGEKSAGVALLGQLALTFLTSGAAKALLECLRPYFERDRSLSLVVERSDGSKVRIEGKDLKSDGVASLLKALQPPESTRA